MSTETKGRERGGKGQSMSFAQKTKLMWRYCETQNRNSLLYHALLVRVFRNHPMPFHETCRVKNKLLIRNNKIPPGQLTASFSHLTPCLSCPCSPHCSPLISGQFLGYSKLFSTSGPLHITLCLECCRPTYLMSSSYPSFRNRLT